MKKYLPLLVVVLVVAAALAAMIGVYRAPSSSATTTSIVYETSLPRGRASLVDVVGHHVSLETPVRKIVVVCGGDPSCLLAIDAVAGCEGLSKVVAADLRDFASTVPQLYKLYVSTCTRFRDVRDLGALDGIDADEIVSLEPDVVVMSLKAYTVLSEKGVVARVEDSGIPIVVVDFGSGDWRNLETSLNALGAVFDSTARAKDVVEWLRQRLSLVTGRLADITYKPRVYLESGRTEWVTWSAGVWDKLVRLAGGANIAENVTLNNGRIGAELVAKADPEVIIVVGGWPEGVKLGPYTEHGEAESGILAWVNRSSLRVTSALRHYRVCGIYHVLGDTLLWPIGVEAIAKALHPAVFRDVNPVKDLEVFFERFLSIPYRGAWFACTEPPQRLVKLVDAVNRTVYVKAPARRIVVLYGLEDLVAVSGEYGLAHLVALNKFRYVKWRPDWWHAWVTHFPWLERLPDVGQPGYSFNPELILKLKPDVVIVARFMYQKMLESGDVKRFEDAGIPVVVIDFVPPTSNLREHLETVKRSIYALGVVTGYLDRAKELYEFYKRQLMLVVERLRNVAEKPKILVLATWAKWRAYGRGGMYQVWIEFAKGENIAARVVPGTSGEINPELVLREDPDVIVFTCNNNLYTPEGRKQVLVIGYNVNSTRPAKDALRMLTNRPGWNNLKAVREGRVYLIHHGLSHGHIFQFAALQWIAKWLHPKIFEDLNPLENLREFYKRFMPYPLRGVWAVGIQDP